ncbi:MAG: ParB-like protein, partial [Aeromonas bestiarum]
MRIWILLALAISQGAWALAPCERGSPVGSWCEVNIDQLHPTQGGVGQIQVDNTQAELAGKSAKQLDKLMKKKEIPI